MKKSKFVSFMTSLVMLFSISTIYPTSINAEDSSIELMEQHNEVVSITDEYIPDPNIVTVDDMEAIQSFILNRDYNGSGRAIDLNDDGIIDSFDMILARKKWRSEVAEHASGEGIIDLPSAKVSNEEDAIVYLDSASSRIGLENSADKLFRLDSVSSNTTNEFYVMQQQYNGVDVYGGSVSLVLDEHGNCDTIVDSYISEVSGDTTAELTSSQAAKCIKNYSEYSYIEQAILVKELMYPTENGYNFAYQFLVNAISADEESYCMDTVYVDADTGEVLDIQSSIQSSVSYESVPQVSETLTDSNGEQLKYNICKDGNDYLLYDDNTGIMILNANNNTVSWSFLNENGKTFDSCDTSEIYGIQIKSTSTIIRPSSWLTQIKYGDFYNSTHKKWMEYTTKCYDYYKDHCIRGFKSGKHNDNAYNNIYIIINDGLPSLYNNAHSISAVAWYTDSALITISPELTLNCSLDLIAHEYTHSILAAKHKLLYYDGEEGALNEAYADIMGEVIENDKGWIHGTERFASIPRFVEDDKWISTNQKNNDHGGVHSNCNVIFHCAYLMYDQFVSSFDMSEDEAMAEIGNLWYDSMDYLKTTNSNFVTCLKAVYKSGVKRGYSKEKLDMIVDCFREVGITCDDIGVKINAVDESGNFVDNVRIRVDGTYVNDFKNSDFAFGNDKNKPLFLITLKKGWHSFIAYNDEYESGNQRIKVDIDTGEITLVLKKNEDIHIKVDGVVTRDNNRLSLGTYHSAYITEDGSLYTWGDNYCGVLGNGTTENSSVPIKIMDNVVSVSSRDNHGAAITEDGSLYMWGSNNRGKLGSGTTENSSVPLKIMDNVNSVSLGFYHSTAITEDGSLYTWGWNSSCGHLGNGTTKDSSIPIKVMDNVVSVSLAGSSSAAITEDGSLYMWGDNYFGQLGNGTTENSLVPIKIMDNVVSVSLEDSYSAAITKDGSLYMWGLNFYGQLGNETTENSSVPLKIMDNVVSVSLESSYSAAITEDGSLYMWGLNGRGQLGNGTTKDSLIPIKIMDNVVSASLGHNSSTAITEDGSLYMWGACVPVNGTKEDSSVPLKIMNNVVSVNFNDVNASCMADFYCAVITEDGSLYMWGSNSCGELGDGTTEDSLVPIKVNIPE